MLFEILHFDFFSIPPIEIAKLSVEVADRQFSDQRTSLRRLLYEKANRPARDLFDTGLPEGMKKASKVLEKLIGDVPNTTLQALFENCIRETGILGIVLQSPDKIWQMQVLTALFEFIKEESRRNPDLDLEKLIQMIDLMKDNGLTLPLMQVSGSDKAVNLLTAHGSKGWNSSMSFLPVATLRSGKRSGGRVEEYKYPDTMFARASASNATEEEELRRLFYVALTRRSKSGIGFFIWPSQERNVISSFPGPGSGMTGRSWSLRSLSPKSLTSMPSPLKKSLFRMKSWRPSMRCPLAKSSPRRSGRQKKILSAGCWKNSSGM